MPQTRSSITPCPRNQPGLARLIAKHLGVTVAGRKRVCAPGRGQWLPLESQRNSRTTGLGLYFPQTEAGLRERGRAGWRRGSAEPSAGQPADAGSSRSRAKAAASSSAQRRSRSRQRVARRAWKESRPAACRAR